MPIILENTRFRVKAHDQPHQDRNNGGHIVVAPIEHFEHVHQMPVELFTELMLLVRIVEQAVIRVMRNQGVPIIRSNIQINGNWAYKSGSEWPPSVHVHLYMRTLNEKHPANDSRFQAFPEALVFPPWESGYYSTFQPLTEEDCALIRKEIARFI